MREEFERHGWTAIQDREGIQTRGFVSRGAMSDFSFNPRHPPVEPSEEYVQSVLAQKEITMKRRANYEIVAVQTDPATVTIRDLGGVCPSVTNDAEAVVDELLRAGTIQPGMRLFYYDSSGDLDELLFDAHGFAGFKPGPGRKWTPTTE